MLHSDRCIHTLVSVFVLQLITFPLRFRQVKHFNIPVDPKWLLPPLLIPWL